MIKFRAWDSENKVMFYQGDDPQCNEDEVCEHPWVRFCCELESIQYSYQLMQFTGLLDSKGVEIYEGDIAQHENESSGDIFMHENGYWAIRIDENRSILLGEMSRYFVVIGNVHENPELLNP